MSIEKLQQLHAQKAYAQAAKPRPNGAKKEESPFEDFAEKGLLQDIQPQPKENRDIVDFSQKERERLEFLKMMEEKRAAENAPAEKKDYWLESTPSSLTSRLVGAQVPMEVRNVMADAGKAIAKLQLDASLCQNKAERAKLEALIRQFKKVMNRAVRKVGDLNTEEVLRAQGERAKKAKQYFREEEIKNQLKSKQAKRRQREEKYLRDANADDLKEALQNMPNFADATQPGLEAQIAAEAQIIAAAEMPIAAPAGAEIAAPAQDISPAQDGAPVPQSQE